MLALMTAVAMGAAMTEGLARPRGQGLMLWVPTNMPRRSVGRSALRSGLSWEVQKARRSVVPLGGGWARMMMGPPSELLTGQSSATKTAPRAAWTWDQHSAMEMARRSAGDSGLRSAVARAQRWAAMSGLGWAASRAKRSERGSGAS